MAKYDVKLQFASLNGINLTNFGDAVCEYTKDGDAVEIVKGIQGDSVTMAKYDQVDNFRITQDVFSPIWGQVENWEKYHTALTFQFKDENTGITRSSTTAYIKSITRPVDGAQGEINITCEEVK